MYNSYACFPTLGVPDAPESVEFVLSATAVRPAAIGMEDADEVMQAAIANVVSAILDGRLI